MLFDNYILMFNWKKHACVWLCLSLMSRFEKYCRLRDNPTRLYIYVFFFEIFAQYVSHFVWLLQNLSQTSFKVILVCSPICSSRLFTSFFFNNTLFFHFCSPNFSVYVEPSSTACGASRFIWYAKTYDISTLSQPSPGIPNVVSFHFPYTKRPSRYQFISFIFLLILVTFKWVKDKTNKKRCKIVYGEDSKRLLRQVPNWISI